MNWEKTVKSLGALITCLASIVGIHVGLKDETKLEAYVSYDHLTYPSQYSARVDKSTDKLKYGYLYDGIKGIANGGLSHDQIDKVVTLSQAPYLHMFDLPFENGLENYRGRLFIQLLNTGDKVVKDVHIKLPAKGLVEIRDDEIRDTVIKEPTNSVVIPSIVQNGVYRVWVYFEGDLEKLKREGLRIGYSDGVAHVQVFESFFGLDAWLAKHGAALVGILATLVMLLLLAVYFLISSDQTTDRRPGTSRAQ